MDKYFYFVDNKPYLNITNKCSNDCEFCIRNGRQTMDGQELWIKGNDPTPNDVLAQIPDGFDYRQEFVFCGFGEPTENYSTLIELAKELKNRGAKVRLNTNGQSDLINGKPTAKEICQVCDAISISLNDSNATDYQKLCQSRYGTKAFDAMLNFAKECGEYGAQVFMSVVDVIGETKVAQCQQICNDIGVTLKVRKYIPLDQY